MMNRGTRFPMATGRNIQAIPNHHRCIGFGHIVEQRLEGEQMTMKDDKVTLEAIQGDAVRTLAIQGIGGPVAVHIDEITPMDGRKLT
jgi:hypothetical protein